MTIYTPPLDNIRFVLDTLNAPGRTQKMEAFQDADWDTVRMVMETSAKFFRDVAHPLNRDADEEACAYHPETASVTTPKGFKEAFEQFRELGLIGLNGDPAYGGAGMPNYLGAVLGEMGSSSNFSFAAFGGLTAAAAKVLERLAPEEIKQTFIPKMYAGNWTGTMCLTEAHAGTDLGLMRTRAVPHDDEDIITGSKIFITNGEHDMAENICHLVLARLPDAPEGTGGISLFLVPKFMPETGARNDVKCTGIEKKMGINGSPTCSISFDGAKGWLIGKPHKGMNAMFIMMNDARLKCGLQGLGLAEIAYQQAASWAADRVQGKLITEFGNKAAPSVTIVHHANVRKDLLEMQCKIEGFRALAYETAIAIDLAEKNEEPGVRENAEDWASLLTPIVKACLTDLGCEVTQKAIQMHGGSGFIRETGVEQFYRDALIATIYEGTNEIQSMDFTFRKVLDAKDFGYRLGLFTGPMMNEIRQANPKLAPFAVTLKKAAKTFSDTTWGLVQGAMTGQIEDVLVHARDFTTMFGSLAAGRMWLKMMNAAQAKLDTGVSGPEAAFYKHKLTLGDYYLNHIMELGMKHLQMRIDAGVALVMGTDPQDLSGQMELGIALERARPDNGRSTPPIPG